MAKIGATALVVVGTVAALVAISGNGKTENTSGSRDGAGAETVLGRVPSTGQTSVSSAVAAVVRANTLRICTTYSADELGVAEWRVPAHSTFEHGGILIGDIRDKWELERYRAETTDRSAALVTSEEAVLTADHPCADVQVRMLISAPYRRRSWNPTRTTEVWDFKRVLGYPRGLLAQPHRLQSLQGKIALRATSLGPITESTEMTDAEAVALDPGNPLNRIPADSAQAEATRPPAAGNLRVCLSRSIDEEPYSSVRLPQGLIFEAYGRHIGNERAPEPDREYLRFDDKTSQAVMLVRPLTLTKRTPCGLATARSVMSREWRWIFPLVRADNHLRFQPLRVRGVPGEAFHLPGNLGVAMSKGLINASPTADIGSPMQMSGDD